MCVCLQGSGGDFGPRSLEEVETSQKLGYVRVTATKSGKLQEQTLELILNDVIDPYVNSWFMGRAD